MAEVNNMSLRSAYLEYLAQIGVAMKTKNAVNA